MAEFQPVQISNGSLSLEVLPYGVTIHRLLAKVDGQIHDLVIGPEQPRDHKTQKYTNSIVGRYANRIPVGTHILQRGEHQSELVAKENENPRVSLHGGPVGFDAVVWSNVTTNPSLFTEAEISKLASLNPRSYTIFQLTSPDGDQGYPGKLLVETLIAIVAGESTVEGSPERPLGSVVIVYRAKLDEGEKKVVTPVNLTQHWGFNLDASLPSHSLSIKEHTLDLKTDQIVVRDANSLSTGFADTSQDAVHTHERKAIGELYPEAGYDDYYALKSGAKSDAPTRISVASFGKELDLIGDLLKELDADEKAYVGELASKTSGFKLRFDSNQRGLMVYTNGLSSPAKGARKTVHGGSGISGHGDAYGPGHAVFLEFHDPLAAFLDPANKNEEDTLVTSEEIYHNFVRCNVLIDVR